MTMPRGRKVDPSEHNIPANVYVGRPAPLNKKLPPELAEKQDEVLRQVAQRAGHLDLTARLIRLLWARGFSDDGIKEILAFIDSEAERIKAKQS